MAGGEGGKLDPSQELREFQDFCETETGISKAFEGGGEKGSVPLPTVQQITGKREPKALSQEVEKGGVSGSGETLSAWFMEGGK